MTGTWTALGAAHALDDAGLGREQRDQDVGVEEIPTSQRHPPARGIVVIRLSPRSRQPALLEAIRTLLPAVRSGSLSGKLWIVHQHRIREYQPES